MSRSYTYDLALLSDLAGDPLLHGRGSSAEEPGGVCADPRLRVSHAESRLDPSAALSSST